MTGNATVVRMLVKVTTLDINLADNEGNTALHLAAQAGQFRLFLLFVGPFYSEKCVGTDEQVTRMSSEF